MNFKKVLLILFAALFFLTALTFYLNRVIFPRLIKKIAIERIEETLKRKVEIGSIHFNWVRGFIIDRVKVYEKDSDDVVFAQAEQVSFGIIFFPGLKHYRISIPFINVHSPSVHLIRKTDNTWNFSDMFSSPAATPAAVGPVTTDKAPSFQIAWGGLTISDGKFLFEDHSTPQPWSEFFDNINLKLSLSYQGINYDFTADIPRKGGFVGATVYYQPITQNTQAQIHLKNIDTASYLSLINFPDITLNSGIIQEINLNIDYTQDKTSAQGNILMKNLDLVSREESFKGDIDIRGLDAQYRQGDIVARGQMLLSHIQTKVPGLSAGGSVQARVSDFELSPTEMNFSGSLDAQNIFVRLKDRQVQVDNLALDNIKINKNKDGIQSVGYMNAQGLFVQWPDQQLQGDFIVKNGHVLMKNENDIALEGDLQADHFSTSGNGKSIASRQVILQDTRLNILDQKNVSLNANLSMEDMSLKLGKNLSVSASTVKTDKLLFSLDDSLMHVSTTLNATTTKLVLDHHKTIEADPQLELNLEMPLSDPKLATYKGSMTLSGGRLHGFSPVGTLDNVELDVDFQNNKATINALSVNVLGTNVRIDGTVENFDNPFLNIIAEADEVNLDQLKNMAPQIIDPYGLSFDGTSMVKVQFKGLAKEPLKANILAVATVKNVGVSSSKFHQKIKNITGILEATPDSLKWRDFSAIYQGQKYTLSGNLKDFKHPQILTTLDGPGLELSADVTKNNDFITFNAITGRYLKSSFDSKGSITLRGDQAPLLDINCNVSVLLEDLVKVLPTQQREGIEPLTPTGIISVSTHIKGEGLNWKDYALDALITSPVIRLMGYRLIDLKINAIQNRGKVNQLTLDGNLYGGIMHAVGSLDLSAQGMPYDLGLNVDNTDLHQLKMDSPLKMEEINGKFFLTFLAHGTVTNFKDNLRASGSLAIRDGFLAEFDLFKGLLSILNDALHLGQVMITDVEANFTIANQKINTDNLRLKGPTIVLLGKGWVNFDRICDLDMTVDLSSGIVPAIANDVLKTLDIHIYDKIENPKYNKKISVPQVLNSLLKNFLQ